MARPKSRKEQAVLMCSLVEQASDLPPVPLTPASERRWALEFEGSTLRTYRRMPNSRCVHIHPFAKRGLWLPRLPHVDGIASKVCVLTSVKVISIRPLDESFRVFGTPYWKNLRPNGSIGSCFPSRSTCLVMQQVVACRNALADTTSVKHCSISGVLPQRGWPAEPGAVQGRAPDKKSPHPGRLRIALAHHG